MFPPAEGGRSDVTENGAASERRNGRASESNGSMRSAGRVGELEQRVDRLTDVCRAMWELLSAEVGLDLDQLAAMVEGMADESTSSEDGDDGTDTCPGCSKAMPIGSNVCLFCMARSPGDD